MMRAKKVYVLVCDGGRSRVYAGEGRVAALAPVTGTERVNDAEIEPGERATGYSSTGSRRYSVEEHGDRRRDAERAFLLAILDQLAAVEADFDRLVIVAPPRALGEIRKAIPRVLQDKLAAEISADLTRAEPELVATRVAAALVPGG